MKQVECMYRIDGKSVVFAGKLNDSLEVYHTDLPLHRSNVTVYLVDSTTGNVLCEFIMDAEQPIINFSVLIGV